MIKLDRFEHSLSNNFGWSILDWKLIRRPRPDNVLSRYQDISKGRERLNETLEIYLSILAAAINVIDN